MTVAVPDEKTCFSHSRSAGANQALYNLDNTNMGPICINDFFGGSMKCLSAYQEK